VSLPGTPRAAFEGIAALLRARYPGAGLSVFGSAANALGIRDNNDIDVSLSLEGLEDTREAKGARAAPPGRGWRPHRARAVAPWAPAAPGAAGLGGSPAQRQAPESFGRCSCSPPLCALP
jgi:hypothetical protein